MNVATPLLEKIGFNLGYGGSAVSADGIKGSAYEYYTLKATAKR